MTRSSSGRVRGSSVAGHVALLTVMAMLACLVSPVSLPAQVIAEDPLEGVLERTTPSTVMDANQDGVLDVADLVRITRGERTACFAEPESAEADRAVTRGIEVLFSGSFTGTLFYNVTGSATPGVDYVALPGSLVADGTSALIEVQILKDMLYEDQETVAITILPAAGYSVGSPSTHVFTIQDIEAHFEQAKSVIRESSETVGLQVAFNRPYRGPLKYTVTGSATLEVDFQLPSPSQIVVDGTRAVIPIDIIDDLEMEDTEFLTVDIDFNFDAQAEDLDYDLGVPTRALLLINDNDTVWTGTLVTADSEETFQMEVRTNGAVTEAAILSASNPDTSSGFLSTGTIPAGTWTATAVQFGNQAFDAAFGPLPLGSLQLFGSVKFQRSFQFFVHANRANHLIRDETLVGEFISIIEPATPGRNYLKRESTGPVFFVRGMSHLPFPEHEIINP